MVNIRSTRWDDRGSLALGRTAGAGVFWCSDAERLSIMVGQDDETWDFAVTLPLQALDEIVSALGKLRWKDIRALARIIGQ